MKKLIPAIVMLLVSAVVLSTASYAWFTNVSEATASGMSVTAEAPSAVLIRVHTADNSNEFGASVDLSATDDQPVVLTPASSVDGKTFYAPDACEDASGAMAAAANVTSVTGNQTTSGTTYYLEYTLDFKNAGTEEIDLVMKSITVSGATIKGAIRVAVLDAEGNSLAIYAGDAVDTGWVQYPIAEDKYAAATGALGAAGAATAVGAGATTEYKLTAVTTGDKESATPIINIPAEAGTGEDTGISEKTLIVRIWIEGQSKFCISNNANTNAAVELKFEAADHE